MFMMNPRIDNFGNREWCDDPGNWYGDDDLPAIKISNDDKSYYFHGKRHRTFGPSSEYHDNKIYWYWLDLSKMKYLNFVNLNN